MNKTSEAQDMIPAGSMVTIRGGKFKGQTVKVLRSYEAPRNRNVVILEVPGAKFGELRLFATGVKP